MQSITEDPDFRETVAVAKILHSWDQACAMGPVVRKAFLFAHHEQEGAKINWRTGEVSYPKPTT